MKSQKIFSIITRMLPLFFIIFLVSCSSKTSDTTAKASTTAADDTTEITITTTSETAVQNDPQLIGKWIPKATFGNDLPNNSIEFFADSTAIIGEMNPVKYRAADGELMFIIEEKVYKNHYEMDGMKLTIFQYNGDSIVYYNLETANEKDPRLIGKWVEEDASIVWGLPSMSVEYCEDGTCMFSDPDTGGSSFLMGTYQIADGKMFALYGGEVYPVEYYEISGKKLTMYIDDSRYKVYIKEE